jgi:hypothetical protein
MSGYRAWCLDAWRTHQPGVTDVPGCVARLGGESVPALAAAAGWRGPVRVAVTVDGEPPTHAELDEASARWAESAAHRTREAHQPLWHQP